MSTYEQIYQISFLVLIFFVLYPYVLYPIALFLHRSWKGENAHAPYDNTFLPFVSIIIAAHNEEKVIEDKIKNTMALDYPTDKVEILIASDGSDDKTDQICDRYSNNINFVRIEPRQGKANVLNTLAPMARGDIILFSDANTIISKDSLKNMIRHFSTDSIGAVSGRLVLETKTKGVESYEKTYWNYESKIKNLESKLYSTIGANGANYAIKKQLFKPIPKDTIIEDFWISINILEQGKEVYFEKTAVAWEPASQNLKDEFWRKVRIGSGNLQTFIRKPRIFALHKSFVVNFSYYSHKLIRWIVPVLLPFIYLLVIALSHNPGFLALFYLSHLLLLLSLLGLILDTKIRIINIISYFLLFNFALLVGYFRYLIGRETVIWKRARR